MALMKSANGLVHQEPDTFLDPEVCWLFQQNKRYQSPQIVGIKALFGELNPLLQSSISEKNKLHIEIEENVWSIEVDPTQLESALLNIAINSRDAMP